MLKFSVAAARIAVIRIQASGGGSIAEGTGCGPTSAKIPANVSASRAASFRRAFTVTRPLSQCRPLRVYVQFRTPALLASATRD